MTAAEPRPATVHDARAIVELEEELFGTDAWGTSLVTEELTAPHRAAWVIETAGGEHDLAGYVVTMTVGDVSDLQRIGVRPQDRRHGVATALLAAATDHARAHRAERMLLEVSEANAGARAFYQRAGFREIDRRRRYYQDDADAIVMLRMIGGAT